MMTEKQAFALGFLAELADRGIPPHLLLAEPTEKAAAFADLAEKASFLGGLGAFTGTAADLGLLGGAVLVGAPLLGGKLVGGMMGAAGDVDKHDVEEAQAEELTNLYARETERLKRLKQERDFHEHTRRVGRPFTN